MPENDRDPRPDVDPDADPAGPGNPADPADPAPPSDPAASGDPAPPGDLTDPRDTPERREFGPPHRAALLGAIALGGVIGAEARWAVGLAWPHRPDQFPWSTLVINVTGCLLIGLLMVVITEKRTPHPLVRPLLGVGVLGGYTTFSTYAVEAVQAVDAGRAWVALGYVVATPVLAVLAVAAGASAARSLVRAS